MSEQNEKRFEIEKLEERIAPASLMAGNSGLTLEGNLNDPSAGDLPTGSISGTTPGGRVF